MKCILVAVDHSASSLRATDFAAELASKFNAALVLLTVAHSIDKPDAVLEEHLREEHIGEPIGIVVENAARSELQALRDRLTKSLQSRVSCEVVVGDAAEAIVSFAGRGKVDLIAIGHVGHGRIAGLLLGSVAKRVIDTAPCPVLVVR